MIVQRAAVLAIIGITILAAACDAPPELPPDARVSYDTINGVVHVVSGDRGAWLRGGSWDVDRNGLVIGSLSGPEEYTFGEVGGVLIGSDGRIYVGDARAGEVRVYDPQGALIARLGRTGGGVGELRTITAMARAPDGVGVLDARLSRLTVFRLDGSVARSFRIDRPYPVPERSSALRFDDRGRLYDRTQLDPSPAIDDIAIMIYDRDGRPTDAVRVAAVAREQVPFAPAPSVAIGGDGRIYFTRGDEYRITVLSPAGDTVRVLRRRVRPRPVTAEERDSALAIVEERHREAGAGPPPPVALPERKPVIAELFVDETGHLWVRRYGHASWSHMEWGVHAPDGRYLGAVATPVMRVMHIGERAMAGVLTDGAGVERVAVFPIRR